MSPLKNICQLQCHDYRQYVSSNITDYRLRISYHVLVTEYAFATMSRLQSMLSLQCPGYRLCFSYDVLVTDCFSYNVLVTDCALATMSWLQTEL
jgi:hypothetical protein